jgi:bifunctional ADP-heptose synthase (sugar kinase/adenylyltransferase)
MFSLYLLLNFAGGTAPTQIAPVVDSAVGVRCGIFGPILCAAAAQVMSQMKLQSLVITRGRDGMVAFTRRQKPADIPIFGSDQAADVTGAGDTVIATFTAAVAAGASAEDAAHLANYAGGIVVMKRGTATASQQELLQALDQAPPTLRAH